MKKSFNILLVTILFMLTSNVQAQELSKIEHKDDKGYAMVDTKSTAPDSMELKMIDEINLVRTKPAEYVPFVEDYIKTKKLTGTALEFANELVKELKALKPLPALKYAPCMFETAKKHAVDQGTTGQIDHNSTTGHDPSKRMGDVCPNDFPEWVSVGGGVSVKNGRENLAWDVNYSGYGMDARRTNIQLLVDAGVPSRGHRKTILMEGTTHCAAFVYQDYMADGTRYDRWIQMFGRHKDTPPIHGNTTTNTSNNNTSTNTNNDNNTNNTTSNTSGTTSSNTIPTDCPQTQPGKIEWPNLIDGKEVSKECWQYWWDNWK